MLARWLAVALVAAAVVSGCSPAASPSTRQESAAAAPQASTAEVPLNPEPSATMPASITPAVTPIPGCLPACLPGQLTRPGLLPAGDYQTQFFFGGQLIVTVPDGRTSFEDSTGEFGLRPGTDESRALYFWIDIYPIVDPTTKPVASYDGSARALLDWIAANPNVKVSHRGQGTLGGASAEVIEFGRGPKATNVDPGCPAEGQPCVGMFSFPQSEGIYSQGGPFKLRKFAADVSWVAPTTRSTR